MWHSNCIRNLVSCEYCMPALLEQFDSGDQLVVDELTPMLYKELRRIAARQLYKERPDHTLQATALVHEVYMKLCGHAQPQFANRAHFLAIASHVMRRVLVDYARARSARKRRGPESHNRLVPMESIDSEVQLETGTENVELLDLDRALGALSHENEMLARLVEMKYFGGMTAEEAAEELGQPVYMVRQDLRFAQAWLRRRLSS
jgi:RNA polymerase sigma factor (TIGR02999 family)